MHNLATTYEVHNTVQANIQELRDHLTKLDDKVADLQMQSQSSLKNMEDLGGEMKRLVNTYAALESALEDQAKILERGIFQQEAGLSEVKSRLNEYDETLRALSDKFQTQTKQVELPEFYKTEFHVSLANLEHEYAMLREFLDQAAGSTNETDRLELAIEQVFRGSDELITRRQALYLDALKLQPGNEVKSILDVGCGRGEFLKLLHKQGIKAVGIDANESHVKKLQTENFEVHHSGAVEFLQKLPDEDLLGITAFQVIEHFPFQYLLDFIKLAHSKIMKDGFILLESVNTYCLDNFRSYYLDPSHHQPIPKDLLVVLMMHHGFHNIQAFYQNPIPTQGPISESEWILHYQTYALMGTKG